MEPHGELASTGYVLANPGVEYLIVITAAHAPDLTVDLPAGTYTAQWHDIATRGDQAGQTVVTDGGGRTAIRTPFGADHPGSALVAPLSLTLRLGRKCGASPWMVAGLGPGILFQPYRAESRSRPGRADLCVLRGGCHVLKGVVL